jgi:hypothetical protein
MKSIIRLFIVMMVLASPAPIRAQANPAVAESKLAHSSVSVLVEPQLNDGRLVVRIAAKNFGATAVPFGPANVVISKPAGEVVALYPLQALLDDVRIAAGMTPESSETALTQGAYASPQMNVRDGKVDPTGFTGGSTVGRDEYIRRNQKHAGKPSIGKAEAESQIAALKRAILPDSSLAPGQIAAGQVVSQKLTFKRGEDRTLHLRIRFAGDEHAFTIEAPAG